MDILKIATDWAKAEVFSARFFILFGILFVIATIGFWQLGKTDTARAYIFPTLVAGLLLLAVGLVIFFTNKSRATNFPTAYESDPTAFVQSEIARAEKTISDFQNIVFRGVPAIVIVAALLIVFVDKPIWRAISITTIGLMMVVSVIDSNSKARMEEYHKELMSVEQESGE